MLWDIDEERFSPETRIAVIRLFFIAHKIIAMEWLSPSPPTFENWQIQVSNTLLFEIQIYQYRGTPNKLSKLWEPWLMVPGLAPLSLVFNSGCYRSNFNSWG